MGPEAEKKTETEAQTAEGAKGVLVAKKLVQRLMRAFYEGKHMILLDQLIKKEAMREDELAARLQTQGKEVHKVAQKLIEDKLVSEAYRNEVKLGAIKATSRRFYYVDYRQFIDVVKWKISRMNKKIQDKGKDEIASQGWICPRCKKAFTTLDAYQLIPTETGDLACDICGAAVIDNENTDENRRHHDQIERLAEQTATIMELLKEVDKYRLPIFNVEAWLNEHAGPESVAEQRELLAAKANTIGKVEVEIADDEDGDEQKAKLEREKAAKAAQNALPEWIAKSTVSGDLTTAGLKDSGSVLDGRDEDEGDKPGVTGGVITDYAKYYASLQSSTAQSPLESSVSVDTPIQLQRGSTAEASADETGDEVTVQMQQTNGKRSREDTGEDEDGAEARKRVHVGIEEVGEETGTADDPLVSVKGQMIRFSQVSDEMHEEMTPEEYTAFWEILTERSG